jgi:hypothetical protein
MFMLEIRRMPTEMRWLVDRRVMLVEITGTLTEADMNTNMQSPQTLQMWEEGIPLVHMIVDMRGLVGTPPIKPPKDRSLDPELKRKMDAIKMKTGWNITITHNTLVRFGASILGNLMQSRQRFFGTVEDALDFLQEQDETLPNLRHIPRGETLPLP